MSKSRGNVVNPDDFVETYGSDTFRMYMMFMGSYEEGETGMIKESTVFTGFSQGYTDCIRTTTLKTELLEKKLITE